jgi:signal transduction histidine kinase
VSKHAQANEVTIRVDRSGNSLTFERAAPVA